MTEDEETVLEKLNDAVYYNRMEELQNCIKTNTFLSTKVDAMRTAACKAISVDRFNILKELFTTGLFSNSALSEFLHDCIVSRYRLSMIEYLIEKGANVCRPFTSGGTPLSCAAKKQDIRVIETLLKNGAQFTSYLALFEAVKAGNSEIIDLLFENGALINFQTIEGSTPLIQALDNDTVNLETVEKLVKKGADVNLSTPKGTPLTAAISTGVPEVVDFLVRNKADVNLSTPKGTPLEIAVNRGVPEIVDIIIRNQAEAKNLEKNANYPILRAIETRNNEIVKILVKNNAKLDIFDKNGDTLFMKAVRLSNLEMIKCFIEHGADVNQKDQNGLCALSIALLEDDFAMFDLLIQLGANPDLASESIQAKVSDNPYFALYVSKMNQKRHENGLNGQGVSE